MQCVDLGGRRIIKKTLCGSWAPGRGSESLFPGGSRRFFQAEDGIRDVERSRGLGDVYKRQLHMSEKFSSGMKIHIQSNKHCEKLYSLPQERE